MSTKQNCLVVVALIVGAGFAVAAKQTAQKGTTLGTEKQVQLELEKDGQLGGNKIQIGTDKKLQPGLDGLDDSGLFPKAYSGFAKWYPGGKWSPPDDQSMQTGSPVPKGSGGYAVAIAGLQGLGPNKVIAYECTAIHLGDGLVVTAEHCLFNKNPARIVIAYGSLNLNAAQPMGVIETACNSVLDVGLLVLQKAIKIPAATLVKPSTVKPSSGGLKAMGWGDNQFSAFAPAISSPDLLQVTMKPVAQAGACVASDTTVCAEGDAGAGPCAKDSGGPLVGEDGKSIAGILTTADGCPRPANVKSQATYASGDKVDAWVKEVMALTPEQRRQRHSCMKGPAVGQ